MRKLKKLPKFKNEKDEFKFWSTHDSTEYIDYSKGKRVLFPNLKPSTITTNDLKKTVGSPGLQYCNSRR